EQPHPEVEPRRPAVAVPPSPVQDIGDHFLDRRVVRLQGAKSPMIAQLAPNGSRQLRNIRADGGVERLSVSVENALPLACISRRRRGWLWSGRHLQSPPPCPAINPPADNWASGFPAYEESDACPAECKGATGHDRLGLGGC